MTVRVRPSALMERTRHELPQLSQEEIKSVHTWADQHRLPYEGEVVQDELRRVAVVKTLGFTPLHRGKVRTMFVPTT
ncbi:MAG: hypothetical protein Q7S79_00420 [bacterium]|nr:hypothetical protein [bacterium]